MKRPEDRKVYWIDHRLPESEYNRIALDYLERKCIKLDNGCWKWGQFIGKKPNDYGHTSYRGQRWRAHRLAYYLTKGAVPDGLDICHSCDNKWCCNPEHVWAGTPKANMQDAAKKMIWSRQHQTHCRHGHEFTAENTYRSPGRPNKRVCKECQRIKGRQDPNRLARQRRYRAEKRRAVQPAGDA